jgi:hypothetical protein
MAATVTIALLIAAMWVVGLLVVVAMCRSAARGDRGLAARFGDWSDSHEHPLAA